MANAKETYEKMRVSDSGVPAAAAIAQVLAGDPPSDAETEDFLRELEEEEPHDAPPADPSAQDPEGNLKTRLEELEVLQAGFRWPWPICAQACPLFRSTGKPLSYLTGPSSPTSCPPPTM